MAATLTQDRFSGPEWLFERKLDGVRLLAYRNGAEVKLFSRNRLPQQCQEIARAMWSPSKSPGRLVAAALLAAIERENMKAYGYGAKGFTLSMLQTALEISNGKVSTKVIQELLDAGREMMTHPAGFMRCMRAAMIRSCPRIR